MITFLADAIGTTQLEWSESQLEFFGVYAYGYGTIAAGHSFTIVPEPAPGG